MDINDDNIKLVVRGCISAIQMAINDLKTLNLMVIGKTGAGKSTLINALFGEKKVETAIGRPVTQFIKKTEVENYPLAIYDTPGLELNQQQQIKLKQEVMQEITDCFSKHDVSEAIHCILYCINAAANRVEDVELNWIRELTEETAGFRIPVIVVLTQAYLPQSEDLKTVIERENLHVAKVVKVVAKGSSGDGFIIRPSGLDTLLEVMAEVLPEDIKKTLSYVQKASLELKKKNARIAVSAIATSFTVAGATPISLADVAILSASVASIISAVSVVFGKSVSEKTMDTILALIVGAIGVSTIPNILLPAVLKMIPGIGSVAGAAVSGAVTFSFSMALGEVFIRLLERHFEDENDLILTEDDKQWFQSQLKMEIRNKNKGKS